MAEWLSIYECIKDTALVHVGGMGRPCLTEHSCWSGDPCHGVYLHKGVDMGDTSRKGRGVVPSQIHLAVPPQ